MRINSNAVKTIGSIVLSVLMLVAIVIYIPKPEFRRSKRRPSFKVVNTDYLKLAVEALSKTTEASETAHQKLHQFINREKIDISPLRTANTAAIDALAEADKSIKRCNEELEKFKDEEPSPTMLIEANSKLIAAFNDMSEMVKTLHREVTILETKSDQTSPPSLKKVEDTITKLHEDAIIKLNTAIRRGTSALSEVIDVFSEYYELDSTEG